MSDLHPDLQRLLEPLHDQDENAATSELSAAARARVLSALQTQVQNVPAERRRARRLRMLAFAAPIALAAAAGIALAVVQRDTQRLAVHVVASGASPVSWTDGRQVARELRDHGDVLGKGELVVPPQTSAQLTTASGVWMEVAEHTRLGLTLKGERAEPDVLLRTGLLHCRVPRLERGHSFVVATEHARVVVHGTDFSVNVGGSDAALADQPCVRVREGLVEVQRAREDSVWLRPGDSWGCVRSMQAASPAQVTQPAPVTDVLTPEPARTRPAHAHKPAVRVHKTAQHATHAAPLDKTTSTLERENRLLGLALSAERRGDGARAQGLFQALLTQY
ncbi:MAG: FecR protein, partial [Pseudomonadota bacterium]